MIIPPMVLRCSYPDVVPTTVPPDVVDGRVVFGARVVGAGVVTSGFFGMSGLQPRTLNLRAAVSPCHVTGLIRINCAVTFLLKRLRTIVWLSVLPVNT